MDIKEKLIKYITTDQMLNNYVICSVQELSAKEIVYNLKLEEEHVRAFKTILFKLGREIDLVLDDIDEYLGNG